ncbi:nuclear transport factor 2 family protein [Actinoplanes derwentensis]|uniref:SnoaL-like domain-containing protein n=1 Tax=Actinoplanes derwentensis TaxID=113562 RepID=A0A1H2BUI6_9ACTN|nr:nuclear transport factor 2 family protein [Actinoplanes derwentensis]GID83096.1 isomerase [Actinoplanes derwentensis]SDT61813.1 SnoaL-like domain-containing protein [Actinoplanes derwentensis]
MSDFNEVIERYLTIWNEADSSVRRTEVDVVFAAGVRYVDPLAAVEGRDALDALIGAVREQFAGLEFSLGGPVDAHHDQARFTWHLGRPGEEPLVIGFDVAERDAEGRIRQVFGFIDKAPGM